VALVALLLLLVPPLLLLLLRWLARAQGLEQGKEAGAGEIHELQRLWGGGVEVKGGTHCQVCR
jgi:hypothetical protein